MTELSNRLRTLADMLSCVESVADVGCDHGYVSIYLVKQGRTSRVYAMDINEGPLLRAKEHIREAGMEGYIETRLSDGVSALKPGEAQAMICAGMGGRLMARILTEGSAVVRQMTELVLQPQSEIGQLRRFLRENGYKITEEEMVLESGKYYPMMKAVPTGEAFRTVVQSGMDASQNNRQRLEDKFGRVLLVKKHPVLISFLKQSALKYEGILRGLEEQEALGEEIPVTKSRVRMEELRVELADMRTAVSMMEDA